MAPEASDDTSASPASGILPRWVEGIDQPLSKLRAIPWAEEVPAREEPGHTDDDVDAPELSPDELEALPPDEISQDDLRELTDEDDEGAGFPRSAAIDEPGGSPPPSPSDTPRAASGQTPPALPAQAVADSFVSLESADTSELVRSDEIMVLEPADDELEEIDDEELAADADGGGMPRKGKIPPPPPFLAGARDEADPPSTDEDSKHPSSPPAELPPARSPAKGEKGAAVATVTEQVVARGISSESDARGASRDEGHAWFEEVFDDSYFKTLPPGFHKRTLRETDFIAKSLGLEPESRVLDLACGFGRHTIELARRGHNLVGLDLSRSLLERGLDEAQRRDLAVKFVHGDMRELNFAAVFDAVFNVHTSFGYFDDRTNYQVLESVSRALKPGGRFLLEIVNRDWVVGHVPRRIWWDNDDTIFLEEVGFDYPSSRLEVTRTRIQDISEPVEHEYSIRLYSLHEISVLLQMAGLDVVEVSGSVDFPGFFIGESSRNIWITAERRAR